MPGLVGGLFASAGWCVTSLLASLNGLRARPSGSLKDGMARLLKPACVMTRSPARTAGPDAILSDPQIAATSVGSARTGPLVGWAGADSPPPQAASSAASASIPRTSDGLRMRIESPYQVFRLV